MSSRDGQNDRSREPVRLQSQSSGVISDIYQGQQWIECVYSEDGIVNKEERYIFRCSSDRACCGRECCIMGPVAAAGIPLWLLIVLLVLLFLLVLFLLALVIYFCCNNCRRKRVLVHEDAKNQQPVTTIVTNTTNSPPRVEVYKQRPALADQPYRNGKSPSNSVEAGGQQRTGIGKHRKSPSRIPKNQSYNAASKNKRDMVTVLTDLDSSVDTPLEPDPASTEPLSSDHDFDHDTLPPSQPSTVNEKRLDDKTRQKVLASDKRHLADAPARRPKIIPFEPSPMEETYEKPVKPIPISYHEESEISIEKRPLLNFLHRPEEQRAQMMYNRSATSQVPSYNDMRPNY